MGKLCPKGKIMDDFTITTIYFDGQFWCAFIQKQTGGNFYTGRHVFGSEPSNPQILEWMLSGYSQVRLYKTDVLQKVRVKDYAKKTESRIPKSFVKFKEAQKKEFMAEKIKKNKQKREEKKKKHSPK